MPLWINAPAVWFSPCWRLFQAFNKTLYCIDYSFVFAVISRDFRISLSRFSFSISDFLAILFQVDYWLWFCLRSVVSYSNRLVSTAGIPDSLFSLLFPLPCWIFCRRFGVVHEIDVVFQDWACWLESLFLWRVIELQNLSPLFWLRVSSFPCFFAANWSHKS